MTSPSIEVIEVGVDGVQHDGDVEDGATTKQTTNNGQQVSPSSSSSHALQNQKKKKKRNINSYYGHKIGFYQTLSLILNAGLMLYAHLGLSAVIYSSRDPNITSLLSSEAAGDSSSAASQQQIDSSSGGNNSSNENSTDNSQQQSVKGEGTCNNEQDVQNWIANGASQTRPTQSNYCSRIYTSPSNNNANCLVTPSCISECFQTVYNYSPTCSDCFAQIPTCSMANFCTFKCAADSFSTECEECNVPCVQEFMKCSGFLSDEEYDGLNGGGSSESDNGGGEVGVMVGGDENESNVTEGTILPPTSIIINNNNGENDTCNRYDLNTINKWYTAYELTFIRSIQDAWDGDAQLLAIIIVLFSGIWPYAKNVILIIVWYTPMKQRNQEGVILWLSRLSKYTLVDVFAVVGVLVGVQLQLNVGGTDAVIRAEPRFGIIAFFLATLWEFLQIELIKVMYERKVVDCSNEGSGSQAGEMSEEGSGEEEEQGGRLLFKQLWIPILIYIASIALYISGSVTELIYFQNSDIGSSGVCLRSFNLATLGNALVSPSSLTDNSAAGQTWILYIVYVILVLAFPVITHILQVIFMAGWSRSIKLKQMIKWTSAIWCFACIEVLLIGVFAVEFKFPQLIMKLAGETNAGFLDIKSGLGNGFYILIVYAVVAGFMQFSLIVRSDEDEDEEVKATSGEGTPSKHQLSSEEVGEEVDAV